MKINFIFFIINIIISFIARSVFIKVLGADITGLNSLYLSLIGLLNVAELGVGTAVGYSLYEPLSKRDFSKIEDIMSLFKYYYNNIAKIILGLGIILSLFLSFLIKGQIDLKLAYIYYFMYLLNCVISYFFTYKQTLIIADQKQYKISFVLNLVKIIKVVSQTLVILVTKSFFIWIVLDILFNLLGMKLANNKIDKEYECKLEWNKKKSIKIIKSENLMIGKNIRNVFFHKIGGFVVLQTDSILISIFSTLKETAIYANYMMIINSLTGLLSTALGSVLPSIGNLIVEESNEKSYKIFKILYLLDNLIAIFICTVTFEIINEFIVFWVGKEYLFSTGIILVMVINLYIQITRGTIDRFKDCFGIYWDINAPIVESIINLIVSILLASRLGIIGIFIGTLISNILIIIFWKPYILFKEGFKKNSIVFFRETFEILLRNLILFFISNFIFKKFIIKINFYNLFLNLVIHTVLISILSLFLMFLLYINKNDFKEIINLVLNQIKKILNKHI